MWPRASPNLRRHVGDDAHRLGAAAVARCRRGDSRGNGRAAPVSDAHARAATRGARRDRCRAFDPVLPGGRPGRVRRGDRLPRCAGHGRLRTGVDAFCPCSSPTCRCSGLAEASQPPFGAPQFDQLVDIVDRLVVDSAEWDETAVQLLVDAVRHGPPSPPAFIAWARGLPAWRGRACGLLAPRSATRRDLCAQGHAPRGPWAWLARGSPREIGADQAGPDGRPPGRRGSSSRRAAADGARAFRCPRKCRLEGRAPPGGGGAPRRCRPVGEPLSLILSAGSRRLIK